MQQKALVKLNIYIHHAPVNMPSKYCDKYVVAATHLDVGEVDPMIYSLSQSCQNTDLFKDESNESPMWKCLFCKSEFV